MWQTGGIPTSSHHWAWHEFGPARADLSIRCRGSESDLESLVARACDCEYRAEDLELMHREAAEFRREFQSVLAADEYDWEDDGLDDSCRVSDVSHAGLLTEFIFVFVCLYVAVRGCR